MKEEERLLVTIRRIIRATDIYSRQLSKTVGLTVPQLLLLQNIRSLGSVSISKLASEMNLSQATVTNILDRLVSRGLVERRRSESDKRVVNALLTKEGRTVLKDAPEPLQAAFSGRFRALADWERSMILASLQRVAEMMDAESIDAAPYLELGQLDQSARSDD